METVDLRPAYRWQKRFLQHRQLRSSIKRLVLKSPDHVFGLEELLAVFPDAIIIQTHRDPLDVLKSQIQLTQLLEGMFCRPAKVEQLQVREARKVAQMLDYISRFRDAHPELSEQFIDVKYSELITDPLAVVRRINEHLGIQLANPTAERMQHIASSRSRYRSRHSGPTLAALNFTGTAETRALDSYRDRFGIPARRTKSVSRKAGFAKATPAKDPKSQRLERALEQTQRRDEDRAGQEQDRNEDRYCPKVQ